MTISALPNHERICRLNEPRTMSIGFALEIVSAGMMPERKPMRAIPMTISSAMGRVISASTEKSYPSSREA